MQAESSKISNEKDNSETLKIEKEKIICKDGFCSIQSHTESSKIDKNDTASIPRPPGLKKPYCSLRNQILI